MAWSRLIVLCLALAPPSVGVAANRLAGETSPYLRMHAENPVDWYPWGDAAFARARAESKPVFISIGYSTCYWCHVMEREVFSDPEIAAEMNRLFVNVKVDREERPDVDEVYMGATRALTRGGGWPNSLFLTPEGDPFFAGTYFPPKDAHGRPGFPTVMRKVSEAWTRDPADVRRRGARVTAALTRAGDAQASVRLPEPVVLLARARDELAASFEPVHGGFSRRVKFPRPSALALLLEIEATDAEARRMLLHTLDEMALGGIYDHLGGGFHRYSTEPTWSVPHFEKMLYDNAQLLGLYARAYARTGRPLYRHVAEDVAGYLLAEMRHPEGGFYSAQDAEVDHEEGASYVWSPHEIESVLGADGAAKWLEVYDLAPIREHPGKGVLRVRLPLEPLLRAAAVDDPVALLDARAGLRQQLLEARNGRPQPLRDDKVLVAWNGLAIRGFVDAGVALERPDLVEHASRAARFVLERLRAPAPDGGLYRSYIFGRASERGVLDDYAFLCDGLLALYDATGDAGWLREARAVAAPMLERFEDRELGGFYLAEANHGLILRPRSVQDGALPSGNGVAVRALRDLASRTGDPVYAAAAMRAVSALSQTLDRYPSALASLVVALNREAAAPRATAGPGEAVPPPVAPTAALPRSADHVRVRLERAPDDASWIVQLDVDKGWHVNANPATLAFLIPTRVAIEQGHGSVEYPAGTLFEPAFAPEALRVYSGRVAIRVLPGQPVVERLSATVHYQACNDRSCLPPSTSRVDNSGAGTSPPSRP